MNTVRSYRLSDLSPTLFQRLKAAQMEAVQVSNVCCEMHKDARKARTKWPGQDKLQQATKGGQFALYSQDALLVVNVIKNPVEDIITN